MQIFYHVTRDIDLPRAGRRSQPSHDGRGCEACGRPIDRAPEGAAGADVTAGAAGAGEPGRSASPGLAFCAECRARLAASAHQIHFCDACGVSLPLHDVQGGDALAKDGRILCPACLRAETSAGRRLLWTVIVALAAAAAGVALANLL